MTFFLQFIGGLNCLFYQGKHVISPSIRCCRVVINHAFKAWIILLGNKVLRGHSFFSFPPLSPFLSAGFLAFSGTWCRRSGFLDMDTNRGVTVRDYYEPTSVTKDINWMMDRCMRNAVILVMCITESMCACRCMNVNEEYYYKQKCLENITWSVSATGRKERKAQPCLPFRP